MYRFFSVGMRLKKREVGRAKTQYFSAMQEDIGIKEERVANEGRIKK
jgi:hypothetical protein